MPAGSAKCLASCSRGLLESARWLLCPETAPVPAIHPKMRADVLLRASYPCKMAMGTHGTLPLTWM